LQAALSAADPGDSILIGPGTYTETGKIYVTKNLTIQAADLSNRPVIMPAEDTGSNAGDDRAWIIVRDGINLTLRNIILDGGSKNIIEAIQLHGTGLIEGNEFRNIHYDLKPSVSDLQYSGTAIFMDHDGTVRNNTFHNIGRVGALACGLDANLTFEGNTYYGKNASDRLDVAAWVAGGAKGDINHNMITGNTGGYFGMSSAGVRIDAASLMCPNDAPSEATVDNNTLLNSNNGIYVGGKDGDDSNLYAHFNRIVGNVTYGILGTNLTKIYDAQYNWWGCNAGPGAAGCDKAFVTIDWSHQLQLSVSASPASILRGEQSSVTASIKGGSGYAPDGTPVTFSSTNLGSVTSPAALSGGEAQATFTSGSETGTATVSAKVDNQTVPAQIVINSKQTFVYFPGIYKNYAPFTNGDFSNGLSGWALGFGPFAVAGGSHGSGLPQSVISVNGNNAVLLGDPSFTDGSIPVGYGYIAKTFTVEKDTLSFDYHLTTSDVALAQGGYYDTFEVSVNQKPDQITDAQRNNAGCGTPDDAPSSIVVTTPLAFCTGGSGTAGTEVDYGVKNLSLDLSAFQGENVTLYFTIWSREYDSKYYDDHAFYNTWVTIDNVSNK